MDEFHVFLGVFFRQNFHIWAEDMKFQKYLAHLLEQSCTVMAIKKSSAYLLVHYFIQVQSFEIDGILIEKAVN